MGKPKDHYVQRKHLQTYGSFEDVAILDRVMKKVIPLNPNKQYCERVFYGEDKLGRKTEEQIGKIEYDFGLLRPLLCSSRMPIFNVREKRTIARYVALQNARSPLRKELFLRTDARRSSLAARGISPMKHFGVQVLLETERLTEVLVKYHMYMKRSGPVGFFLGDSPAMLSLHGNKNRPSHDVSRPGWGEDELFFPITPRSGVSFIDPAFHEERMNGIARSREVVGLIGEVKDRILDRGIRTSIRMSHSKELMRHREISDGGTAISTIDQARYYNEMQYRYAKRFIAFPRDQKTEVLGLLASSDNIYSFQKDEEIVTHGFTLVGTEDLIRVLS